MITTMRQGTLNVTNEQNEKSSVNVDLLQMKTPSSYDKYIEKPLTDESYDEAKSRMQKNLDKLLNYDRYSEVKEDIALNENTKTAEKETESTETCEEDMKPSCTTMQFENESISSLNKNIEKTSENKKENFHLNKKGKLIVLLYSLTIAVIFALIVLNTGVLSSLTKQNKANEQILSEKVSIYNQINDHIEDISSKEHIKNIVENDYGMIIK